MSRPNPALRCLLLGSLLAPAGCAQFQWSGEGPGAPGRPEVQLPDPSPSTYAEPLPAVVDAEPFPTDDRERIAAVQPWVDQVAARYELDPDLINAVIWVESRFQPRAKSPAGARGLMQLMPATANALAREMGRSVARVYDPEFNIEAGSLYIVQMLARFDGDETLALAAYNAGAGNVNKWMRQDGQLPPRSLRYVELVQHARGRFVAMRQRRDVPGQESKRTMIAAAGPPSSTRDREPRAAEVPPPPQTREQKAAEVPPTPRRANPQPRPSPAPEPEPVRNPLAPDPDVYRPEPTPEPPLAETPYPPRSEPAPAPSPRPRLDANETVEIDTPKALPSVLD